MLILREFRKLLAAMWFIKVTIELDEQPEGLRWGMSADVNIRGARVIEADMKRSFWTMLAMSMMLTITLQQPVEHRPARLLYRPQALPRHKQIGFVHLLDSVVASAEAVPEHRNTDELCDFRACEGNPGQRR